MKQPETENIYNRYTIIVIKVKYIFSSAYSITQLVLVVIVLYKYSNQKQQHNPGDLAVATVIKSSSWAQGLYK